MVPPVLPTVQPKKAVLPTNHILNWDLPTLQAWLKERGYPTYRAKQIWKWIYEGRAESFEEMTDLHKKMRQELSENMLLWTSQIVGHQEAEDGTEKLLLQMADGGRIECVLLREEGRRSICVSSQVGCGMGCVFCASG